MPSSRRLLACCVLSYIVWVINLAWVSWVLWDARERIFTISLTQTDRLTLVFAFWSFAVTSPISAVFLHRIAKKPDFDALTILMPICNVLVGAFFLWEFVWRISIAIRIKLWFL